MVVTNHLLTGVILQVGDYFVFTKTAGPKTSQHLTVDLWNERWTFAVERVPYFLWHI